MSVTLTLTGVTATATNVSIQIHDGSFALMASNPLSLNGNFSFSGLSVTAHTVAFSVAVSAALGGTIVLPIAKPTDAKPTPTPSIMVNNFNIDSVSVTWPTEDGQVTQLLTPGTAMSLNGLVYGS